MYFGILSICVLAAVTIAVNGAHNNFYSCGWLKHHDCNQHGTQAVCGTNGVTYTNECFLGQVHCSDTTLHLLHHGACDTITTPPPVAMTTVHGGDVVSGVFCSYLDHTICGDHGVASERVCGTDGVTYANFCAYEKATCKNIDLHIASIGDCP